MERLEDLRILADDDPGGRAPARPIADRATVPEGAQESTGSPAPGEPTTSEGSGSVPAGPSGRPRPAPKVFDMEAAEAEAAAEEAAARTPVDPEPVAPAEPEGDRAGEDEEVVDVVEPSATDTTGTPDAPTLVDPPADRS